MKLVSVLLLSAIVFCTGTKNLLFLADYCVNLDYYESVCENQNRPELDCHGKCQISKDAQKTSKNLSFSHFSFDFCPNEDRVEMKVELSLLATIPKISDRFLSFWHSLNQSAPNPPPDIKI